MMHELHFAPDICAMHSFFIAMMYVLHALVLTAVTTAIKQKIYKCNSLSVQTLVEEEVPKSWLAKAALLVRVEYHIARLIFLHAYKLPKDFNFATYVCKGADHSIIELTEIDERSWAMLMFVLVLNAARDSLMREYIPPAQGAPAVTTSTAFTIAAGWSILLSFWAIAMRLEKVSVRLDALAGCRRAKGGDYATRIMDMQHALEALDDEDRHEEEAMSMDQVQSELSAWQQNNTRTAKNAKKKQALILKREDAKSKASAAFLGGRKVLQLEGTRADSPGGKVRLAAMKWKTAALGPNADNELPPKSNRVLAVMSQCPCTDSRFTPHL
jgi:hypothetical protein